MPQGNQNDSRGYQWVDITDFTPGIYSFDPATSTPYSYAKSAPIGSAQISVGGFCTYGCLPIPSGGIGPGPARTSGPNFPHSTYFTNNYYITQFLVNPALIETANDEIIFTVEGLSSSTNWLQQVLSFSGGASGSTYNAIINNQYTASSSTIPVGSLSFPTRMANSSPTTTAGMMVMVFSLPYPLNATLSSGTYPSAVFSYPSTSAPTSYGAGSLSSSVSESTSGLIVGYQGRVVGFFDTYQNWPAGLVSFNENICYTDPTNSNTMPSQQDIVLVPENPFGYTAAGSISAGELFLVKKFGGGAVLTGDMNNPNVTYLPGVQPGGALPSNSSEEGDTSVLFSSAAFGQCASSMNGLYYCSGDNGAWVWNGGNASSKVSSQLNNNFFYDPQFPMASMSYFICRWGEYLMFSNNWMYHERLGSWWRIYQDSSAPANPYFWYGLGKNDSVLYATPASFGSASVQPGNHRLYDTFNMNIPSSLWVWNSQPIMLSEDRRVNIREIALKAICDPNTSSTCSITVNLVDDTNTLINLTPVTNMSGSGMQTIYRIPAGVHTQYATLQVIANNTTSLAAAPSLYSIGIGFRQREKVGTV